METLKFNSLRVIVVGLGSIGNRHLKNLIALGVKNIGIVRRSNPNPQFSVDPTIPIFRTAEEAISFHPDVAIICNPTHLHATTASMFLTAGSAVLVEKPLSAQVSVAEESLAKQCDASPIPCRMAYCMRFHPAYQLAKEFLDKKSLGKCLYAKAWFESYLPAWHPWENYKTSYAARLDLGGGVSHTLDHELDFLSWVLGKPSELAGFTSNTGVLDIEAEEVAAYNLRHNSSTLSQILVSYCRRPGSRGYEFVFEQGTLSFRMEESEVKVHKFGEQTSEVVLKLNGYDINQMYMDMLKEFLNCAVLHTTQCNCPHVHESLYNLRLLEKLNRS